MAIPVLVAVLPIASIKSKEFLTTNPIAVAKPPIAMPKPAIPLTATLLAFDIPLKPPLTLSNAALVLFTAVNSNFIFLFAIIPLPFFY